MILRPKMMTISSARMIDAVPGAGTVMILEQARAGHVEVLRPDTRRSDRALFVRCDSYLLRMNQRLRGPTSRSSKGCFTSADDPDRFSWPLPAITSRTSPGCAEHQPPCGWPRRRSAMRRKRAPGSSPAAIWSRIASGDSWRGLSDVKTAVSAYRTAICAISGRLLRSRLPPQPQTTISFCAVGADLPRWCGSRFRARRACGRNRRRP